MSHHDIHVGDVIKYPEMVMARTVQRKQKLWLCFSEKEQQLDPAKHLARTTATTTMTRPYMEGMSETISRML